MAQSTINLRNLQTFKPSSVVVSSGVIVEPVTLATMKSHLRVEHNLDDALIMQYVASARSMAEEFTGRSLVDKQFTANFVDIPYQAILEMPFQQVTFIVSALASGVTTTNLIFDQNRQQVILNEPSHSIHDSISVTCLSAAEFNESFFVFIKLVASMLYENRGSVDAASINQIKECFLRPLRLHTGVS